MVAVASTASTRLAASVPRDSTENSAKALTSVQAALAKMAHCATMEMARLNVFASPVTVATCAKKTLTSVPLTLVLMECATIWLMPTNATANLDGLVQTATLTLTSVRSSRAVWGRRAKISSMDLSVGAPRGWRGQPAATRSTSACPNRASTAQPVLTVLRSSRATVLPATMDLLAKMTSTSVIPGLARTAQLAATSLPTLRAPALDRGRARVVRRRRSSALFCLIPVANFGSARLRCKQKWDSPMRRRGILPSLLRLLSTHGPSPWNATSSFTLTGSLAPFSSIFFLVCKEGRCTQPDPVAKSLCVL
eukprot:m.405178 g.405178  ORF g.405178 m.405178 type:complete len:308 (+) comp20131_c0_seq11:2527-3450(+)